MLNSPLEPPSRRSPISPNQNLNCCVNFDFVFLPLPSDPPPPSDPSHSLAQKVLAASLSIPSRFIHFWVTQKECQTIQNAKLPLEPPSRRSPISPNQNLNCSVYFDFVFLPLPSYPPSSDPPSLSCRKLSQLRSIRQRKSQCLARRMHFDFFPVPLPSPTPSSNDINPGKGRGQGVSEPIFR
ncbi:hypothetical protein CDAR_442761 [Caerostris darwini]|uniref:Uncharacterized protein n=1 Tax=Caerostris darwini TaxID=1538125 RepID=A0AAV4VNE9_9ARAC|nr:hypothetical protein CDAR_442761 [Caerostris darwini]